MKMGPWSNLCLPAVRWRIGLGIYLLCLSIYLMSGMGHFSSTDQVAVYLTTQSIVEHQNLAIKHAHFYGTVKGKDQKHYGVFGIAQSLASIPLYLVGRTVENIGPPKLKAYWGGVNLGVWGGTVPIYFVSLFNQIVTPLTCVLFFFFCLNLGFSQKISLALTLIYSFSTATWVYAKEYFQHPLETLLLLITVFLLFKNRNGLRLRHSLLAGLTMGLGILTRINLILIVPLIVFYQLFLLYKNHQPILKQLMVFLIGFGLMFIAWMYFNYLKFGSYLTSNPLVTTQEFSTHFWVGLKGNLFSPGRSVFLYSPPSILALFAFYRFFKTHRPEAFLFATIFTVYLLSYATFDFWHGGWCWGPRYLIPTLPFLIIPIGCLLEKKDWLIPTVALAALGIFVQVLGITVNYSYIYHEWIKAGLYSKMAFLWNPRISAIPIHLQNLLSGRNIDLWLLEVYKRFGKRIFLVTLLSQLSPLVMALILLTNRRKQN